MNDRDLLLLLASGPVSGDVLARRFGVTRAAVWKRVRGLREAGVEIEAVAGRGYALGRPVDLLDADVINASLRPQARAGLAAIEVAWSLESTNSTLLARDTPGDGCVVLLAERQTAGRGRRGRQWTSPLACNVYLSLSRRYSAGLARLGGLSLAAGVAVAEALQASGVPGVGLKWPNDIVVTGRKLGGLLVEGSGEPAGAARAVVGLGLNVRMPDAHAQDINQPWVDMAALLATPPTRNALVACLLDHLIPTCALFDQEGLAPFLPRYAALDALLDQPIRVHTHDVTQAVADEGRALGIAEDGALRVECNGRERRFHAGEVSVRAT